MPSEIERYHEELSKVIEELNSQAADILAKRIAASFTLGFHATKTNVQIGELQHRAIQKLSAEQLGFITEFNDALGKQLEMRLKEVINIGGGYEDIKRNMRPYIEEVFGPNGVTIDRTGQTRQVIEVLGDGSLRRIEKSITQPYSASIETYSDMLSRTVTHQAYSRGRAEGYKSKGMNKWRYIAVQDERVRPEHLAMHGRVFEIGSDEEGMALELMSEPNCRCRQIPYFDDEKLNTPDATFEAQKEKFGLEFKDGEWAFKE